MDIIKRIPIITVIAALVTAAMISAHIAAAFIMPDEFGCQKVYAGMATDTLTVNVGYQGGPFYKKAEYSWKDLDDLYGGALPSHQVAYSYYGGRNGKGGRNVVVSARGFYIKDLLSYAGIDLSSIAGFEFYTDDQKVGAFTTITKKELLDTPRYYYPNMGIDDEYNQVALDGGDITSGAVQVQAMFGLEDNWEWEGVAPNFTSMSSSGRFHLLFGQANVKESRTSQAAKYVHTINVIFSGAPVIGTESNIELKVGTDYRVQVNVTAADTELENYIKDNLVWSSNNTDVVEVDQYGRLTVKGDGTAVITAKSGNTTGTVSVTIGNGNGTGSGESQTEGEGKTSDGADGTSAPDNNDQPSETNNDNASDNKNTQVSYSENNKGVYILSRDFMQQTKNAEWVNSVLKHDVTVDSDKGSVMNWRKDQMDDDAQQLIVPEEEKVPMTIVIIMVLVFFMLGLAAGPLKYSLDMRKSAVRLPFADCIHNIKFKERKTK